MLSIKTTVDLRVVTARHLDRGARKHPVSAMPIWWPLFLTARSNTKIPGVLLGIYLAVLVGISSDD